MAVYQEKDKKKWTKDGRKWYYKCNYTDMYGNKKQKKSKMFLTKKDAITSESQFLIKCKTNNEVDLNISFEEVFKEWLQYKKQFVKYTTYYGIEKKMNKYVLKVFKNFSLHSIKTNNLLLWKKSLIDNNSICDNTVNKIIGYFQEILEYARINYEFDIKIAYKLQKNRIMRQVNKTNDSKWNFWTLEEYKSFINSVDNDLDKLMYNFMYFTGLRIGEITALKWENINFENKTVSIFNNLTKIENGGFGITDTKTVNSERIVDLNDNLLFLLKIHYNNEKNIYGFNNEMFVFGNIKHISFTTFRRHLDEHINKCGIKRITPHGFRHSHVSLLIHLGCDSREVAERIGDTVQMIEKTYYHMFPEKKKHTISMLNKLKI